MPWKVPTHRPGGSVPMVSTIRDDTEWRRFINSRAWRRCAKSYLNRNPACVECLKSNVLTPATDVHHTKGQDMEYAFAEETFAALCHPHHSAITRRDQNQGKT
jgi:hypothetical protein